MVLMPINIINITKLDLQDLLGHDPLNRTIPYNLRSFKSHNPL